MRRNVLVNTPDKWKSVMPWIVFAVTAMFTAAGVGISLLLFGNTITRFSKWGVVFIVTVVVMSISYAAKSPEDKARLGPEDVLSAIINGFAWPSAWPAMATELGINEIPTIED